MTAHFTPSPALDDRDTAEPWRDDSDAALAELRAARVQLERDLAEARGLVRAALRLLDGRAVNAPSVCVMRAAVERWAAEDADPTAEWGDDAEGYGQDEGVRNAG